MLDVMKILADSTRLRLLRILDQGDFTVQEFMHILNMGQSRISRHLILMTEAGLLKVQKQGTWHYYRLAPENLFFQKVWPSLKMHLCEVEMHQQDNHGVSKIMLERRRSNLEFFENHAQDWDEMHKKLLNLPDYETALAELLPAGGLTIEVGIGSGTLMPILAEYAEHVIGFDHSASMVMKARETIEKCNLRHKVDVRLAEMEHLPVADHSVRTVIMNQVLHHSGQPIEIFREIRRVMEPNGNLVLADLMSHNFDWMRERLADQWLGFKQEELEAWLSEAEMQICSYQEFKKSDSNHGVLLLMAKAKV